MFPGVERGQNVPGASQAPAAVLPHKYGCCPASQVRELNSIYLAEDYEPMQIKWAASNTFPSQLSSAHAPTATP